MQHSCAQLLLQPLQQGLQACQGSPFPRVWYCPSWCCPSRYRPSRHLARSYAAIFKHAKDELGFCYYLIPCGAKKGQCGNCTVGGPCSDCD